MRRFPKGGRQTPTYFSYFTLLLVSLPRERENQRGATKGR